MKKRKNTNPATLAKNPRVASREIEGQTVLLNLETGGYFVLNGTATVIWDVIGSLSREQIVGRMTEDYKIDGAEADAAVGAFVDQLLHEGLLCRQADG